MPCVALAYKFSFIIIVALWEVGTNIVAHHFRALVSYIGALVWNDVHFSGKGVITSPGFERLVINNRYLRYFYNYSRGFYESLVYNLKDYALVW